MVNLDLFLQAVAAEFQNESAAALAAAATRHLQEAEQAKNGGNEHWWGETRTVSHYIPVSGFKAVSSHILAVIKDNKLSMSSIPSCFYLIWYVFNLLNKKSDFFFFLPGGRSMRPACWPSALSKPSSQRTWRTVVSSLTCMVSWLVLFSLISTWQVRPQLTYFTEIVLLKFPLSVSVSHAELITTKNLIIELNDFILGGKKALMSFFTAVSCFCFLLTSGVAVPPWPSSVGGQSLHGSHVSWAHPAVPPGHRQRPPWQPAALCPHLRGQGHLGVSKLCL